MSLFDDDNIIIHQKLQQSEVQDCDIFDPSIYTPDSSKYRAEYIKSITAKMKMLIDTSLLNEEAPEGEQGDVELITEGEDPEKIFTLIFKYLKGERGFNGSVDNFVVLSESQYNNLRVKDPNKFYYVYEDEEPSEDEHIEGNILYGEVENNIYLTKGTITNNILKI